MRILNVKCILLFPPKSIRKLCRRIGSFSDVLRKKEEYSRLIGMDAFNSFLTRGTENFFKQLDQTNFGTNLDHNRLTSDFFFKVNLKKKSADDNKSMEHYPACKTLNADNKGDI